MSDSVPLLDNGLPSVHFLDAPDGPGLLPCKPERWLAASSDYRLVTCPACLEYVAAHLPRLRACDHLLDRRASLAYRR